MGAMAALPDGSGHAGRARVAIGRAARAACDNSAMAPRGLPRVLEAAVTIRGSADQRSRDSPVLDTFELFVELEAAR
jgi:hypothetical protein